eukprot:7972822-Pyramimonas_sp.AAC.1
MLASAAVITARALRLGTGLSCSLGRVHAQQLDSTGEVGLPSRAQVGTSQCCVSGPISTIDLSTTYRDFIPTAGACGGLPDVALLRYAWHGTSLS